MPSPNCTPPTHECLFSIELVAALRREMTVWGRGCEACLSECGDSSPLLLAATRRGEALHR